MTVFSDDNQLYKSAHLSQLQEITTASQACISEVQALIHNNILQLNADKTEMIIITSTYNQKSQPLPSSIDLTGNPDTSLYHSHYHNLGVILDQNIYFQPHISRICQICYLELHRISTTRHYLSQDASIFAFVLSGIDYWNPLLAGYPKYLLHKLQNNAARLICRPSKFDHISPILRTLHWLPVDQSIAYKLLLPAYTSLN